MTWKGSPRSQASWTRDNASSPEAAVVISTHLIADVEKVLDEVIFINRGQVMLQSSVDQIREEKGMSVDALFREIFRAHNMEGGAF